MNDAPPRHPDAEIAEVTTLAERFLRLEMVRFRHRLFSGEWSGERLYDVIRVGRAIAILLYDPERDAVVLIEQFRLPSLMAGYSPWPLEIVAGLVDHAGEEEVEVARRETEEEAGLSLIGEPIPIQRFMPTPGSSDQSIMLYLGRVDSSKAGGVFGLAHENEDIRVVVKPLAEAAATVDAGEIDTGHTLISLYWLLRHRDRLRREWGFE